MISLRWRTAVAANRRNRFNAYKLIRLRVLKWVRQINVKKRELQRMFDRYKVDPSNVTTMEWEYVVKGAQYKLAMIMPVPRHKWPAKVQYPNLVALNAYAAKEKARKRVIAEEKRKADETSKRKLEEEQVRQLHEWRMEMRKIGMEKMQRSHSESARLQWGRVESVEDNETWLQISTWRHRAHKDTDKKGDSQDTKPQDEDRP
jgi:DNA-binding transcriptional MerR regulator